jgi:hypothetical protein
VACYQGGDRAWKLWVFQKSDARRGIESMADRAVECWRKAKQCAAIARAATDPDVQRIYNELVRQWREMAERVEQMERRLKARSAAADIEGSPGAASGGTQQSRAGAPGR